jgi:hypothetical protein
MSYWLVCIIHVENRFWNTLRCNLLKETSSSSSYSTGETKKVKIIDDNPTESKKIVRVKSFPAFKPMHTSSKSSPLSSGIYYLNIYIYVHVVLYIYIYMYLSVYIYMYVCIGIHIYPYIYVHVYLYVYINIYIYISDVGPGEQNYRGFFNLGIIILFLSHFRYTLSLIYTYTYIYIYIFVYLCIYIHMYRYTYM